jgi:hypothetical protein
MSKVYEFIDRQIRTWLLKQPVFFVATAPLSERGHVNVSPKGMAGTFAVLGTHRVAYLDYTGTGAETIAHLRENGRITLMFCAFEGPPKIVRLHGKGRFVLPRDEEFANLRAHFSKEEVQGQRSIIVIDVERVSDACGWSVPHLDLRSDRTVLDRHHHRRDDKYFEKYWRTTNATSIDGLPAMVEEQREPTEPEPAEPRRKVAAATTEAVR